MKQGKIKLFGIAGAAVVLLSVVFVPPLSRAEEPAQLIRNLEEGKSQTLVTYGTSLTCGPWRSQLIAVLKANYGDQITVMNGAKGGQDSRWGREHIESNVLDRNPDTVTIEFSMNDAINSRKISLDEARNNLQFMIDAILGENPATEIILLTMNCQGEKAAQRPPEHPYGRPTLPEHYQMVRDVAKERNLRLIDLNAVWVDWKNQHSDEFSKHLPDGIHPDETACREVILPAMIKGLGIPVKGCLGSRTSR